MGSISHGKTLARDYAAAIGNSYHRSRIAIGWRLLTRQANLRGLHAYDFGCGEGIFMRRLLAASASVAGCDPDAELLALAPATAELGSVECIERAAPASADILIALHVLSYLKDEKAESERFWREAARVVKPGGYLLFTNSNEPHKREFTPTDRRRLPEFLHSHGFDEVDHDFTGYYPRIFRWKMLYGPFRLEKRVEKLFARAGRVYHPWRLALVPRSWLAERSVCYYTLARRQNPAAA